MPTWLETFLDRWAWQRLQRRFGLGNFIGGTQVAHYTLKDDRAPFPIVRTNPTGAVDKFGNQVDVGTLRTKSVSTDDTILKVGDDDLVTPMGGLGTVKIEAHAITENGKDLGAFDTDEFTVEAGEAVSATGGSQEFPDLQPDSEA
jgi:hypothetical protein